MTQLTPCPYLVHRRANAKLEAGAESGQRPRLGGVVDRALVELDRALTAREREREFREKIKSYISSRGKVEEDGCEKDSIRAEVKHAEEEKIPIYTFHEEVNHVERKDNIKRFNS